MSVGIVACGALALEIETIKDRYNLDVIIYPLPPLLHNNPKKIAGEVDLLLTKIAGSHDKYAVAYADCGTYGALDDVIRRHNVPRLAGNHCYEVYLGKQNMESIMAHSPGTYFLTDFLVKSFHRSVMVELGLDVHPELRDDYFKNYEQIIWLSQNPTPELNEMAQSCADAIGLPLHIQHIGEEGLAKEILGFMQN